MSARKAPPANRGSNVRVVLGLIGFIGVMGAVPVWLHRRHMKLQNGVSMWASEKPLSDAQIRRGAYLNTGSKDAGLDPDWDHKTGRYKGKKAVVADANPLSPTYAERQ